MGVDPHPNLQPRIHRYIYRKIHPAHPQEPTAPCQCQRSLGHVLMDHRHADAQQHDLQTGYRRDPPRPMESPSPISFPNLLARSPRAGKARTRRARARARPRTSTIRGIPIPDTSHTPPNHPTLWLFHRQHHRAFNIIIMAHPPLHRPLSAHKPKDITRATRIKADTSPRPSPSPRNRDSTATGRQHTSQLTDQESKPCCKAF